MSMSVAMSIKEQKTKRNKFFLLTIFLFFSMIAFLFLYFNVFFNQNKIQVINSLKQDTKNISLRLHNNIQENFEILDIMSKVVLENPKLLTLENLNSVLNNPKYSSKYKKIAFIYPEGNGYCYNSAMKETIPIDLASNVIFKKTLKAGELFFIDKISNDILYAKVVKSSDQNLGVFILYEDISVLNDILNYNSQKLYYSYLFSKAGYLVIKDPTSEAFSATNVFDWKDSYFNEKNKKDYYNIKYGKPFTKLYLTSNLNYNLMSIDAVGYEDLYVLSIIPDVNFKTGKINFKILVGAFFGVFLFLVTSLFLVIKIRKLVKVKSNTMITKLALYDEVTDGFNKAKFSLEASNIFLNVKDDDKYAFIVMDINNFKTINELYDFVKGNSILKEISSSIKWFLEKNGIVARIMSDNFAILYKYKSEEKIIIFINNLVRAIGEYKLCIKLVPSFGIFKINDYNLHIDTMIDRAMMAKKTVEPESDLRYAFFNDALIEKIMAEKEIENEMYYALSQKQFVMYLQPQVDVLTNDIVGAEALVRWKHPEKGLILPDKFISLFEKNGFITYIDQFILEEVCKLLQKWIQNGIELFPISVNISKLHLCNPRFVDMVASMAEMYKIQPKFINLEFKEDVFFEDIDLMKKIVGELTEKGFGISIDNFGKNYSAISILNDVSVDFVKFDKEFVTYMLGSPRGKVVLKSCINLIKELYTKAVAVGIESEIDFKVIKDFECDYMQGYYFSRPMQIIDFENFIFKRTIGNEEYVNEQSLDI